MSCNVYGRILKWLLLPFWFLVEFGLRVNKLWWTFQMFHPRLARILVDFITLFNEPTICQYQIKLQNERRSWVWIALCMSIIPAGCCSNEMVNWLFLVLCLCMLRHTCEQGIPSCGLIAWSSHHYVCLWHLVK